MTQRPWWLYLGILLSIVAPGAPHSAAAQQPDSLRIRTNAADITFSGRVQSQFNTSSVDGVAPTEMILRRIRFGVDVRINSFVSGRVHPELASDRLSLGDAYGQLTFSPGFLLQAGRFHRPFGVMEETPSLRTHPIERGVRIRGVTDLELSGVLTGLRYGDRDVGIRIQGVPAGAPLGLAYALAYVGGPLQGAAGGELTQQFVGRLTISPADRLLVGAGWSRRDFPGLTAGDDLAAGQAFVINLEFGGPTPAPGLHIVAEAATGDFNPVLDEEFSGAQLWAGYRAVVGGRVTLIEPLVRVSLASIDRLAPTQSGGGTLLTPGINVYLGGLNRLMLNYDVWRPRQGENEASLKAQFQFTF